MLEREGDHGAGKESGHGIVAFGEAEKVGEDVREVGIGRMGKNFIEGEERLAGLHGTVARVLFFGVFGSSFEEEFADPGLEHEGAEIKAVLEFLANGPGLSEGFHGGQRFA